MVQGIGKKKAVALSLTGEGCKGSFLPTLANEMKLVTLAEGKKTLTKPGDASLIIMLSPCQESHYKDAVKLADLLQVPVIGLDINKNKYF